MNHEIREIHERRNSSMGSDTMEDSFVDAGPENTLNLIGDEARGFYQICNIRVYSRELTEAERYGNYKIDEARF